MRLLEEMAVDIERYTWLGVSQAAGGYQDRDFVVQHQGGGRVPQVVETDMRNASQVQDPVVIFAHVALVQRSSSTRRKDQVVVLPAGTCLDDLELLPVTMGLQYPQGGFSHLYDTGVD